MLKALLPSLLACVLLASCAKSEKDSRPEDQTSQATTHMERGEYTEAISILVNLQTSHPEDAKISLHLASAYAGRAGLRVENYWGFTVGYKGLFRKAPEPQAGPLIDLKGFESQAPKELRDAVTHLNGNLKEFYKIRRRLEQIPYVNADKRQDLYRALDAIKGHPTAGGRLYRSVLGLVVTRSTIEDTASVFNSWSKRNYPLCDAEFRLLVDWIAFSAGVLEELADDLSVAFPKDRAEFKRAEGELKKVSGLTREVNRHVKEGAALCARP